MKNKLYLKILGLLIIVGGVSAYYYWPQISWLFEIPEPAQEKEWEVRETVYQEKPKEGEVQILPTADPKWNLYRNFKYGFQIQYPSDWKYIKIFKNNVTGDIFIGFDKFPVDSNIHLNISYNSSVEKYMDKFDLSKLDYKSVNVNGRDIFSRETENSKGYLLSISGNAYDLGGGGSEATVWYIDRMVETLEVF